MVEQQELKRALAEAVRKSPEIRVQAEGTSMGRAYSEASHLLVRGRDHAGPRVGTIILFESPNGWMAHRVIRILGKGDYLRFAAKGDANRYFDAPYVSMESLLGEVIGWEDAEGQTFRFGFKERLRANGMVGWGCLLWIWRAFRMRVTGKEYRFEDLV